MTTLPAPRKDCHHDWQLILLTDGSASLMCTRCKVYDDEEWKGGLLGWVTMTLPDDIHIVGGRHNSQVRVQVPVDVFVRQTVAWNRTTGSVVPEMTVKLTPRVADYKIIDEQYQALAESQDQEDKDFGEAMRRQVRDREES